MDRLKDSLLKMVQAARQVNEVADTFRKFGLNDDMMFEVYGNILDAIFYVIGEADKGKFSESVTYTVMNLPDTSDENRVKLLMAEYNRNYPSQPAPNVVSAEEIRKAMESQHGYCYDKDAVPWTTTVQSSPQITGTPVTTCSSPEGEWK